VNGARDQHVVLITGILHSFFVAAAATAAAACPSGQEIMCCTIDR